MNLGTTDLQSPQLRRIELKSKISLQKIEKIVTCSFIDILQRNKFVIKRKFLMNLDHKFYSYNIVTWLYQVH